VKAVEKIGLLEGKHSELVVFFFLNNERAKNVNTMKAET
jgi:hypothetical protein